ncbi:hypothetical protein CLF_108544 [Clonorchis sinensis]|uniref:Uncharacterized protein n=1 Tax=Clonorchis sinensis TaxID=79923 RepID=G7YI80_CLOSI|nr:hypothetical protein CLF_108544 [Clonorchis sinensis]
MDRLSCGNAHSLTSRNRSPDSGLINHNDYMILRGNSNHITSFCVEFFQILPSLPYQSSYGFDHPLYRGPTTLCGSVLVDYSQAFGQCFDEALSSAQTKARMCADGVVECDNILDSVIDTSTFNVLTVSEVRTLPEVQLASSKEYSVAVTESTILRHMYVRAIAPRIREQDEILSNRSDYPSDWSSSTHRVWQLEGIRFVIVLEEDLPYYMGARPSAIRYAQRWGRASIQPIFKSGNRHDPNKNPSKQLHMYLMENSGTTGAQLSFNQSILTVTDRKPIQRGTPQLPLRDSDHHSNALELQGLLYLTSAFYRCPLQRTY